MANNIFKGTRIRLIHMNDEHAPVPDGTLGTVKYLDDTGRIFVQWDNGRTLPICPDTDQFDVIRGVTILPETTKDPISTIGKRAGVCWGADVNDPEKNFKRGMDCIKAGHGRTLEYVMVDLVLDGYSARVIREWYTHLGGAPTRLQASTRYINYKDFGYVTPPRIANNPQALEIYNSTMRTIAQNCRLLEEMGIPREDSAMQLPMGMTTKIVDHRNLRNLIDMSRNRLCSRAYWEFRGMLTDILNALRSYSKEWAIIIDTQIMAKCEYLGYCPESKSCGRKPQKQAKRLAFVEWDVDIDEDYDPMEVHLPTVIEIPDGLDDDGIADYLSDMYEYCVKSFTFL